MKSVTKRKRLMTECFNKTIADFKNDVKNDTTTNSEVLKDIFLEFFIRGVENYDKNLRELLINHSKTLMTKKVL